MRIVTEWMRENTLQAGLVGVGVLMMLVGVYQMRSATQGDKVVVEEVLGTVPETGTVPFATLVVDVAGAVETPGVFEMDEGSRIADALVAAGGLSADANRNFIARELNQAQKLTDGMKLFIPAEGDELSGGMVQGAVGSSGQISVNTASESELDRLWGVGASRAKDIVVNRPYATIEELVSKAGLPENIISKNEGVIGL